MQEGTKSQIRCKIREVRDDLTDVAICNLTESIADIVDKAISDNESICESSKPLDILDAEKCMFCGVDLVPEAKGRNWLKEDYVKWIEKYGAVNHIKGRIAGKPVCESCRTDIWALVQEENY